MTTSLNKAIKQVLKEIDNFLTTTLRDQTLDKAAQKERTKLIDSLQKLYNDYSEIKPTIEKGETRPAMTKLSSIGSQPSEEGDSNGDNSIPQTTVAALKGHVKIGYLLQRKPGDANKKLFKQKKDPKKYCVIHENIMYWFLKASDKSFHGAVYLNGCHFEDVSRKEKEFVFQLVYPSKNTTYEFQADNKDDLDEWKKAVETGIECGKQKEANAFDDGDVYAFDAVSTSYVNDIPTEGEECGLYDTADNVTQNVEEFKKRKELLGDSIPRERPPQPPNTNDAEPVRLPFGPKKGKAEKETKPEKTKKTENEVLKKIEKLNKLKNPNYEVKPQNLPQNKTSTLVSASTKPKTLSEVKLKPVTLPTGMKLQNDNDDEDYLDDEDGIYSRIDAIPDSKPPQLPQRGEHFYVNDPDHDNLIYETV